MTTGRVESLDADVARPRAALAGVMVGVLARRAGRAVGVTQQEPKPRAGDRVDSLTGVIDVAPAHQPESGAYLAFPVESAALKGSILVAIAMGIIDGVPKHLQAPPAECVRAFVVSTHANSPSVICFAVSGLASFRFSTA